MSTFLLVDIGNSRLKWACVDRERNPDERHKKLWDYSGAIDTKLLESKEHCAELAHYIKNTIPKPTAIGLCCVAAERYFDYFNQLDLGWEQILQQRLLGNSSYPNLRTQYQNTHTLGADRWAGLIAARQLSSDNTLVINAGTATTIDFLGANGVHYGGWILPGIGLMRESLLQNTAGLSIPDHGLKTAGIGLDTASAIDEGALLAHLGAITRALDFAKQKNQPIAHVWLDGGFADKLLNTLEENKIPAEKISGLVLRGVWAWLNTQVNQN
jgi:type III pantothenate kinase